MKVGALLIKVFVFDTEDEERVRSSLSSLLQGLEFISSESELKGHYGNRIKVVEYRVSGQNASSLLERLLSSLSKEDKLLLITTLRDRLIGSKLHLRLDKQRLVALGKLSLKDGDDVIKVIVSFIPYKNENIVDYVKKVAFN
jgi:RNA binding exosome subunit